MREIEFGTDGWRAVVGDGFTLENVKRVARAMGRVADTIEAPREVDRHTMIVGYDRRFLSLESAGVVAEQLAKTGKRVVLSTEATPSQTVSHAVKHNQAIAGVVVTASHNPGLYNGLKYKAWYGGSAVPEIYQAISDALDGASGPDNGGEIVEEDILSPYLEDLRSRLDLPMMRDAALSILHDPIHGVASGLVERVAGDAARVTTIRGERNASFGEVNPEPIPGNLDAAVDAMKGETFDLAICNDGDADRLGILDERGRFVTPHQILSLLALDLVRRRGETGEIVRTFSTTTMLDRIGEALGAKVHETPIGFKYVADLMLERDILIGGEESGGVGFGSFLPERDGILSGLRVAEAVAGAGKRLSEMVEELEREFGSSRFGRRDVSAARDRCEALIARASAGELDAMFGKEITSRARKDGIKLSYSDGSWILFRMSGTEPLIRIYCETTDGSKTEENLSRAVSLL